jgi:hypothetical protein
VEGKRTSEAKVTYSVNDLIYIVTMSCDVESIFVVYFIYEKEVNIKKTNFIRCLWSLPYSVQFFLPLMFIA